MKVDEIRENKDGSAVVEFELDDDLQKHCQEEGLKLLLYCAAANLSTQTVYDFIRGHIEYEEEEYKFGVE